MVPARSAWLAGVVLAVGCGARTGADDHRCLADVDCSDGLMCTGLERCEAGRCVDGSAPSCDDGDPCTLDRCAEPSTADAPSCLHTELRVDGDGDGRFAVVPGRPECGGDCDDGDAAVHDLAEERCNGRDDDCDDAVDEGAAYSPALADRRVTATEEPSARGSLAYSPAAGTWGATHWAYVDDSADAFFVELAPDGTPRGPSKVLTPLPADAFATDLVWAESSYGVAWEDRRDGDYEIYFNRLTADGEKLGPDVRVTHSTGWSLLGGLAWTGSEFVIVWQDGRHEAEAPGNYEIYAAFLDREGFEIGDDLRLTSDPDSSEAPSLAVGTSSLGVAWVGGTADALRVHFLETDLHGAIRRGPLLVSSHPREATAPAIAWTDAGFVVVWNELNEAGDMDLYAARVPRDAAAAPTPPTPVATGPSWSRRPSLLSNHDRLLVAYSDDRSGVFEQLVSLLDADLRPATGTVAVSHGPAESVFGMLARGGDSVGLLYNDMRDGNWEVYFSRLVCVDPSTVDAP